MPENELQLALPVSKVIADALQKTYSPARMGLFIEGFDMDHAHIKLIPLYSPNDINNQTNSASIEDREKEAQKIKNNF
ncbi:MAG: hypothetical protein H6799_01820 [Candidatus Nomurabacteria bacterium]|nr:MAG: hypothetical protein H6799_01820 [Candidatus Nomurabacteria bacterium]